jgi:DNA mismatch repair protein MutS2
MFKFDSTNRLEYEKVKQHVMELTKTYIGHNHVQKMEPLTELRVIEGLQRETEEARTVIQHGFSVPIPSLEGMEQVISGIGKGLLLTEAELMLIRQMLDSTNQLKRFMVKKESIAPHVTSYASSLFELRDVREEIERCIRHGQVVDEASTELSRIRKKMHITEERMKKKLESTLQRYSSYLQEHLIGMRGDHYVLSVKKEYRKQVTGTVHGESASGQTVFIEPADIVSLTYELSEYRSEEAQEVYKVLGYLTQLTESHLHELNINLETIGHYDFLFAKAKYAQIIDAREALLNKNGLIRIVEGRHPLLGKSAIPLHITIGESYRTLIITGPNTGGKTVALKTVGLLTMMVQSGLLVPVGEGSSFHVFHAVFADIGDGQNLEQSLSTFSSHIKNIIGILQTAGPSTLILLDELATGTDPGEGVGLSIAVLEELYHKGATVIASTHFNEIKNYAEAAAGFCNARMEFDLETLEPLYRLTIGEAGHSYAFYIALKLGMSPAIIERSKEITYPTLPIQPMAMPTNSSSKSNPTSTYLTMSTIPVVPTLPANPSIPVNQSTSELTFDSLASKPSRSFEIGDCVWIHTLKRTGIVRSLPDHRGNLIVQVKQERITINHKRISIYIEKKQLYPEDYDMDIVFESKDVRKKRKIMGKRHDEHNIIIIPEEGKS